MTTMTTKRAHELAKRHHGALVDMRDATNELLSNPPSPGGVEFKSTEVECPECKHEFDVAADIEVESDAPEIPDFSELILRRDALVFAIALAEAEVSRLAAVLAIETAAAAPAAAITA